MVDQKPTAPEKGQQQPLSNRRATGAYRCVTPRPGRAFLANANQTLQARIVDMSLGGIGLILDRALEPMTLVRVELGMGGNDLQVDLAAHICHVTELEDGRWRFGCEWVRPLTQDELDVLRGRS